MVPRGGSPNHTADVGHLMNAHNGTVSTIGQLAIRYERHPILRALLQLLPGWGCADTLLEHRAIELQKARLQVFFDALADGHVLLTEDIVNSNDFLHCYFRTLRAALLTSRTEKIQAYARLLSTVTTSKKIRSSDEYEEYLSVLDGLTMIGIRILILAKSIPSDEVGRDWKEGPFLHEIVSDTSPDLLHSIYLGLIEKNLLVRPYRTMYLHPDPVPMSAIATTKYGETFKEWIGIAAKEEMPNHGHEGTSDPERATY